MTTPYIRHRFHTLDGMRGIAAVFVMLFHYYNHFGYDCFRDTTIAVDFFFILSGFVVFHAYYAKLANGMPASVYLAQRVARLFPFLAIGLFVGAGAFYFLIKSGGADYTTNNLLSSVLVNLCMLPYLSHKSLIIGSFYATGQIFPADDALWSVCAEMIVSIAFLGMLNWSLRRLEKFCLIALIFLLIATMAWGYDGNGNYFDISIGWNTVTFLGLFPRVFFGFSVGMLIYRLYHEASSCPILNRLNKAPAIHPLWLYVALCIMLMFPYHLKGLYGVVAATVIAPLLVWLGSKATSTNHFIRKASEFSGWISYPIYCLHHPVLSAIDQLDKHRDISERVHLSPEVCAIGVTLILSIALAFLLTKFNLQQRLANCLAPLFARFG